MATCPDCFEVKSKLSGNPNFEIIDIVFHEDTETCTPVYTEYNPDYKTFYGACQADIENARPSTKKHRITEGPGPRTPQICVLQGQLFP